MNIGCHLSTSKGYGHMVLEANGICGNTFQFFTRNPRGGAAKELDEQDVACFKKRLEEYGFAPLVAHAPYTLNACGAEERVRDFAEMVMKDDLEKMEALSCAYYNFHPGSHVGQGVETGIEMISSLLNRLLKPEGKCMVLLETMSGKGSEVGSTFEELAEIIKRVNLSHRVGVCLDTCHIYSAGYDLVQQPEQVLAEFDRILGLDKLKAVHLNDSMTPFNSRKDRHACIGAGSIGIEALCRFISQPAIKDLPLILETPNDLDGYQKEIELLRKSIH